MKKKQVVNNVEGSSGKAWWYKTEQGLLIVYEIWLGNGMIRTDTFILPLEAIKKLFNE